MPIVKAKPTTASPEVVVIPKIHSPQVKSNIVDTSYEPISSLMTYVEGSSWTVDYYSQVIDTDNALAGQDSGQSGIYQQYKVIRKLEIKVDGALSWSQDETSKSMQASGTGLIHSLVIPNHGDMFLADVGDGREGVFQISSSEKKSLFKESVYAVQYQLIYFSDRDNNRRADLESKVVQELYYRRDFLEHGQNPLVTKTDFEAVEELSHKYKELINHYFRWFFSKEFKTLTIPGQDTKMYDHWLVTFLSAILNTNDNEHMRYMRVLNCDDDYNLKEPTLWSAILNNDNTALTTGIAKTGFVNARSFSANAMMEGVRFSGINYVVYPKEHTPVYESVNTNLRFQKTLAEVELERVPTRGGDLSSIIYDQTIDLSGTIVKYINSVTADDYYVLSENFYKNLPNQSLLEVMVRNYFENEKNDPATLLKLVNNYANWGALERFYYIPLLLVLIKNIVRNV